MRVLDKTVCVLLSCTLWTGRRRLQPEDLGELVRELPPEELASMGSLKLCDPAELRELARIKRRAERACESLAVKFLGGYATDEANLDRIVNTLTSLKAEFDAAALRMVNGLQSMVDQWVQDHPEWAEAIRRCPPDVNRIAAQLSFEYQVFRISRPGDEDAPANDGLQRAVSGLSSQLYHEIATHARRTLQRSFEGKTAVGQRAVQAIRVMAEKLDALSYLDGGIQPVLEKMTAVRDALPRSGEIAGRHLVDVVALLNFLGNEEQLAQFGSLKAAANGADQTEAAEETAEAAVSGANGTAAQEEAGGSPLFF